MLHRHGIRHMNGQRHASGLGQLQGLGHPNSLKSKRARPILARPPTRRCCPSPSQGRHTLPAGHNAILEAQNTLGLTPYTVSCALSFVPHVHVPKFGRRPLPCVMHCVKIAFLTLGMISIAAGVQALPKPHPTLQTACSFGRSSTKCSPTGSAREFAGAVQRHRAPAQRFAQRRPRHGVGATTDGQLRGGHQLHHARGGARMDPRRRGRGASPHGRRHRHGPPHHGARGSVPTPDDGWIEGPLLVVRHWTPWTPWTPEDTLCFNRPMDPLLINTGAAYGGRLTNAVRAPAPPPKPAPLGCWSAP